MNLKTWLNTWLENYVKPTVKNRTYLRYAQICKLHLCPNLGNEQIDNLSAPKLQEFFTSILNGGNLKTKKGLSANGQTATKKRTRLVRKTKVQKTTSKPIENTENIKNNTNE